MPRPILSDCMCYPKVIMACHGRHSPFVCSPRAMMAFNARHHQIMCTVQGPWSHAMPEFVKLCVLSKAYDVIPRPTSSDPVCYPRNMVTCHAQSHPTCVLSKGYDNMPRSTSFETMSFKRVVIKCHARFCPIVWVVQVRSLDTTRNIDRSYVQS